MRAATSASMRRAAMSVGCSLQVPAQQRLGLGNAVLAQRRAGGQQARVARRYLEESRARRLSAGIIADRLQVIGERAPGIGQIRVEFDGTLEFGDGLIAAAQRARAPRQLVARGRPARLAQRSVTRATPGPPRRRRRHAAQSPGPERHWDDPVAVLRISRACSARAPGRDPAAARRVQAPRRSNRQVLLRHSPHSCDESITIK